VGASFRQVVRKALNKEFQWQYLRPATFISTNNKATPLLNSGDSFPIQLLGFSPSPPSPIQDSFRLALGGFVGNIGIGSEKQL